jgi:hypothetical protein
LLIPFNIFNFSEKKYYYSVRFLGVIALANVVGREMGQDVDGN